MSTKSDPTLAERTRIAHDRDYRGMALEPSEGARVAALLDGNKSVLFMGNHGVIVVVAPSVAQAFDELHYLEKAARLQVLALSTGRPLALVPEPLAAFSPTLGVWLRAARHAGKAAPARPTARG
jgi:ribulose-5-phosphate 4-epimerase/fuculose-1-phosphate aldolase